MELSKSVTFHGNFSIPGQDDCWSGTLRYDPTNGIILYLRDLPLSFLEKNFSIINGLLNVQPHACTLAIVSYQGRTFSVYLNDMISMSKYFVKFVYMGKRFDTINELVFERVDFTYSNLREWLNIPTISTQPHNDNIIVTVGKNMKIEGFIDETFSFIINVINSGSYSQQSFKSNFIQNVSFSIVSKNKALRLDRYLEINKILKYFFMYIQGRYVNESSIACWQKGVHEPYELLQSYDPYKFARNIDTTEHFAHKYDSLTFEKILQQWVKKYRVMPDFFDRYYENIIKEELSPIDKFENLIQSLLYYHKNRFESRLMSDEKYNDFFTNLLNKLNNNEKQFIERFRNLGNQYSMRQILKDIFKSIGIDSKNANNYSQQIIELRNKIEHSLENTTESTIFSVSNMIPNLSTIILTLIRREIESDEENR